MNTRSTKNRTMLLLGVVTVTSAAFVLNTNSKQKNSASAAPKAAEDRTTPIVTFNRNAELVRPTGYRKWIYVGTPLTPHDMNNGRAAFPEFHSVYICGMDFLIRSEAFAYNVISCQRKKPWVSDDVCEELSLLLE